MAAPLRGERRHIPEDNLRTRHYDDAAIDRWRLEPRFPALELGDAEEPDQTPPLWKDLTLASVVALLLWMGAAAVFG